MPAMTEERLRKAEAALGTVLADEGKTADPIAKRRAGKKLRRAQRKRRRLAIAAARRAVKPTADAAKADAAAAPAAEESKSE